MNKTDLINAVAEQADLTKKVLYLFEGYGLYEQHAHVLQNYRNRLIVPFHL
jgi:hypothetical protein